MKKIIISSLLALSLVAFGAGCSNSNKEVDSVKEIDKTKNPNNPVVSVQLVGGKSVKIELYPGVAQNTVNNFISLVNKGFYNGLTFHRVINGFMIQGGDPNGDGTGDPGYSIKGEFTENSFNNELNHTRGVISMARSTPFDSAGSQFFIMQSDAPSLDGKYASFGKVIEGIEIVDEISLVEKDRDDKPLAKDKAGNSIDIVKIQKMTVSLNGYEPKAPETIK